jgi:hypothetical protein
MNVDEVISECDKRRESLEGVGLSDLGVELIRHAYGEGRKSLLADMDSAKLALAEIMMSVSENPSTDHQGFAEFCAISEGYLEDLLCVNDDNCERPQAADVPENLADKPCSPASVNSIYENGSLTPSQINQLADLGWSLYQSNSDYTDIEWEITYINAGGTEERHSINIQITFSWYERYASIALGTNCGSGLDLMHEFQYHGGGLNNQLLKLVTDLRANDPDNPFLRLIDEFQDHWRHLVAAASGASKVLQLHHS